MWRLPVYMNKHWNIKKIGTPLIKVYLIHVVVDDYDEPLALSLWPNLSGFLVRMVFGVPKCLDSVAIESANPLTYLLMMYCTNDMSTNIWTSVDRKRDRQKYIKMWTNYDARLKFGIYPFLLESPEPYVQQIFVLWKIRSSPKYIFLCTLTHFYRSLSKNVVWGLEVFFNRLEKIASH